MTTAADRDYQIADEITRLITVDTLTALQASDRIVLAPTATRDGGAVWSIQALTPGGPARMAMRVELVGGTYAVTILRSGRKRSDPDGIFMHAPTVHADQLEPTIRQSVACDEDVPGACTCTVESGCPEGSDHCGHCRTLDPYDPCPRLGFGCGLTGGDRCDCCTDVQWAAAHGEESFFDSLRAIEDLLAEANQLNDGGEVR